MIRLMERSPRVVFVITSEAFRPHYSCSSTNSLSLSQQVFLDVVESVNLLVNSNGSVVRSEVVGALKMRAYLSGMVSTALQCSLAARP
jgi:hypothetical protein